MRVPVLMIALAPAPVWAQDTPARPSPPDEQVSKESGAEEAATEGSATPLEPRWGIALRFRESWQENPRLAGLAGQSSFVDGLQARASHTRRGPRGELSLLGQGWASRYHRLPGLSRLSYNMAAAGAYRLTPRVRVDLGEAFLSSYSRSAEALDGAVLPGPALSVPDDGISGASEAVSSDELLLPFTRIVSNATTAGITCECGAYTAASAHLRYRSTRFDSPGLADGSVLAAGTALRRRLGTGHSLGLSYGYQRNRFPGRAESVHTASATWARRLSARWSGNAAAGVSGGPRGWTPLASAGLRGRFRRVSVDGLYSRSYHQTFGLGRALSTDSASVGVNWSVTRRTGILGTYHFGLRRDPSDPSFRYTSQSYSGNLSFQVNREIGLGLGYAAGRRSAAGTLAAVRDESASVSVSYGRTWR
jgi:hypothetical protein